ncbi:hypothetical protein C5Y93_04975 [Blastopirellula marina]|uniref:Uncharacterized protein n=1 Tax=Blastopirellula marina TaxID=124 RepID=A0A2S8GSJ5_9BACT|nr:hypothetical protein C5Y93_04975 [Blastopirellula marina]
METPDTLVSQCRNVAKMPDGPQKDSMKEIGEEMLIEREQRGEITAALREQLVRILHSGVESE